MSNMHYMNEAERALRSAVLLIRDEDENGGIDRAYHCAYYAACAAIEYQGGTVPKGGKLYFEEVEAAFRRYLVDTKIFPVSQVNWFQTVHQMYQKGGTWASNEEPFSIDDGVEALNKAGELMAQVRSLVGSPDYEPSRLQL